MNVVSLTAISRKRWRCRPRRGRDRLASRTAQHDAADWRTDLPQLIVETDAFQQPGGIWMDRDSSSDLPEHLGLLEHGYIESPRPKRERGSQTSDTAADDCNANRTRHFSQTFSVRVDNESRATASTNLCGELISLRRPASAVRCPCRKPPPCSQSRAGRRRRCRVPSRCRASEYPQRQRPRWTTP
jgi:hypothetical protein